MQLLRPCSHVFIPSPLGLPAQSYAASRRRPAPAAPAEGAGAGAAGSSRPEGVLTRGRVTALVGPGAGALPGGRSAATSAWVTAGSTSTLRWSVLTQCSPTLLPRARQPACCPAVWAMQHGRTVEAAAAGDEPGNVVGLGLAAGRWLAAPVLGEERGAGLAGHQYAARQGALTGDCCQNVAQLLLGTGGGQVGAAPADGHNARDPRIGVQEALSRRVGLGRVVLRATGSSEQAGVRQPAPGHAHSCHLNGGQHGLVAVAGG